MKIPPNSPLVKLIVTLSLSPQGAREIMGNDRFNGVRIELSPSLKWDLEVSMG